MCTIWREGIRGNYYDTGIAELMRLRIFRSRRSLKIFAAWWPSERQRRGNYN